jgi:hypothetical protein
LGRFGEAAQKIDLAEQHREVRAKFRHLVSLEELAAPCVRLDRTIIPIGREVGAGLRGASGACAHWLVCHIRTVDDVRHRP